jgi:hypothetical protein
LKVSGNNQQKQKQQPPKIYRSPPVNSQSFPTNGKPPVRRKSSLVTELLDDFPIEQSTSIFEVNRKPGPKPKPKSKSDSLNLDLYSNNQRNLLDQISRRNFQSSNNIGGYEKLFEFKNNNLDDVD